MEEIQGWKIEDGKLVRTYVFDTFLEAIAFVNKVAEIANRFNHHPEIINDYTKVTLRLFTHDLGQLTEKDSKLAEEINKIETKNA